MENTTTENTEAATPAETNTPTTTTAPAAPVVNDTDPDFEFLGLRRKDWGAFYAKAYEAEKKAAEAEAAEAANEKRLSECRARLAQVQSSLTDAEEDAAVAVARANAAHEEIDRATSRRERDERKRAAAEADKAAKDAADHAEDLRRTINSVRLDVTMLTGTASTKRDMAKRFRLAADQAAKYATENELPTIQEAINRREAMLRAIREARALHDARRHLVRMTCRDCRHWDPRLDNPTLGECRARPPVFDARLQVGQFPAVRAGDWCALGEMIPAPDETAKDAPGDAAAETPTESASANG